MVFWHHSHEVHAQRTQEWFPRFFLPLMIGNIPMSMRTSTWFQPKFCSHSSTGLPMELIKPISYLSKFTTLWISMTPMVPCTYYEILCYWFRKIYHATSIILLFVFYFSWRLFWKLTLELKACLCHLDLYVYYLLWLHWDGFPKLMENYIGMWFHLKIGKSIKLKHKHTKL